MESDMCNCDTIDVYYDISKVDRQKICDCCGEGNTYEMICIHPATFRGYTFFMPMKYILCDYCGSEYAGGNEMNFNNEMVKNYRNMFLNLEN